MTEEKEKSQNQQAERVPGLIKANKDHVISEWLQRVKMNPELITASLSDAERRDHVPDLLDVAIGRACGDARIGVGPQNVRCIVPK